MCCTWSVIQHRCPKDSFHHSSILFSVTHSTSTSWPLVCRGNVPGEGDTEVVKSLPFPSGTHSLAQGTEALPQEEQK